MGNSVIHVSEVAEPCAYVCHFTFIFFQLPDGSSSSEGLPVVVYIHGGGFFSGGASIYQPDYFVGRNVVLAVVQYRLGSLGKLKLQGLCNQVPGQIS